MATDNTNQKIKTFKAPSRSYQQNIVAKLKLSTIVEALHEVALDKAMSKAKELKEDVRIVNSAVNDDDGNEVFNGGGVHKISVTQTQINKPLLRSNAAQILREYVSGFLGPDEAKAVKSSTIEDLADVKLKESYSIKSFKQFLAESYRGHVPVIVTEDSNGSQPASASSSTTASTDGSDTGSSGQSKIEDEPGGKTDDERQREDDAREKNQSSEKKMNAFGIMTSTASLGYYFEYTLKIDQKDVTRTSNQNPWKGILKSAIKSIFSVDAKIQFWGLGTGGDGTISVKEMIDKIGEGINAVFGSVNPRDFIRNVEDRFNKTYPSFHVTVLLRDQKTLRVDMKDANINANQKKELATTLDRATFFLWIKISKDDAVKDVVGVNEIAHILNEAWYQNVWAKNLKKAWRKISGIGGRRKNFGRQAFKPKNIFHIQNYTDTHGSTEKIAKAYENVPTEDQILKRIKNSANASEAWANIEELIDRKIGNNPFMVHSKRASACHAAWQIFKKDHASDSGDDKIKITGFESIKKYFKQFIDAYKKAYDSNREPSLERHLVYESISSMLSQMLVTRIKRDVKLPFVNEDDTSKGKMLISLKGIAAKAKNVYENYMRGDLSAVLKKHKIEFDNVNLSVRCDTYSNIIDMLRSKEYKVDKLDGYLREKTPPEYGIALKLYSNDNGGSTLDESNVFNGLKNEIASILFNKSSIYDELLMSEEEKADNAKKPQHKLNNVDFNNLIKADVFSIMEKIVRGAIKEETGLVDGDDKLKLFGGYAVKTPDADNRLMDIAFIYPFSISNSEVAPDDSDNTEASDETSSGADAETKSKTKSDDLYIVPLPKVKQGTEIDRDSSSSRYY